MLKKLQLVKLLIPSARMHLIKSLNSVGASATLTKYASGKWSNIVFDFLMDSDQPLFQDFGRLLLFPMSVIFGSGRYERTSNVTRENISHYMRRGAPAGDHFVSLRESGKLFRGYYRPNRYLLVLRMFSSCKNTSIPVKFYCECFIFTRLPEPCCD